MTPQTRWLLQLGQRYVFLGLLAALGILMGLQFSRTLMYGISPLGFYFGLAAVTLLFSRRNSVEEEFQTWRSRTAFVIIASAFLWCAVSLTIRFVANIKYNESLWLDFRYFAFVAVIGLIAGSLPFTISFKPVDHPKWGWKDWAVRGTQSVGTAVMFAYVIFGIYLFIGIIDEDEHFTRPQSIQELAQTKYREIEERELASNQEAAALSLEELAAKEYKRRLEAIKQAREAAPELPEHAAMAIFEE